MSKSSAKSKILQLQDWLEWRKKSQSFNKSANPKRFSKAEYYKKTRERYGYEKSN